MPADEMPTFEVTYKFVVSAARADQAADAAAEYLNDIGGLERTEPVEVVMLDDED